MAINDGPLGSLFLLIFFFLMYLAAGVNLL